MTRDTKIGLLLGLVFIFIIAFLINGIPWLRGSRQGPTPGVRTTRPQSITPGVAVREVAQNMGTYNRTLPIQSNFQVPPTGPDVRSVTPLPGTSPLQGGLQTSPAGIPETPSSPISTNGLTPVAIPVRTTSPMITTPTGTPNPSVAPGSVGTLPPPASTLPVPSSPGLSSPNPMSPGSPQPTNISPSYTSPMVAPRTSSEWPKSYVVKEGDSLEVIAKRHYGAEGIKPSNIKRIFDANKGILKSPERLSIGQKLTIPAPSGSSMSPTVTLQTTTPSNPSPKPTVASSQGQRTYTVKEGDNLWKIARSQLGKDTRYQEILKLNTDTLKNNEDNLEVGMKLHLPSK